MLEVVDTDERYRQITLPRKDPSNVSGVSLECCFEGDLTDEGDLRVLLSFSRKGWVDDDEWESGNQMCPNALLYTRAPSMCHTRSKASQGPVSEESQRCQDSNAVNELSNGVSLLNLLADEFLPASTLFLVRRSPNS